MELFHQIKSDPLRTFLSLFGVSVGIFVVVVSFALVDAFKQAVVAGFDHFGSDMIMVERFPVVAEETPGGNDKMGSGANDGEADWSRYAMRPQPSREDYLAIARSGDPSTSLGMTKGTAGMTKGTAGMTEVVADDGGDRHPRPDRRSQTDRAIPGVTASAIPGVTASAIPGVTASAIPGVTASAIPGVMSSERSESRHLPPENLTRGWTALAGQAEADIVYAGKSLHACKLVGVSGAWQHLVYSSVCEGRDFSLAELSGGDAKVILGAKVAEQLFMNTSGSPRKGGSSSPCGQTVRIDGRNMTVIGVLSHEGKNVINLYATDYAMIVPFATAQRIAGKDALETMIAIGPGAAGRDVTIGEVRKQLRAARRLTPAQEDNFALNTMEDLCRQTVDLTSKITGVGLLVALFSLLIGGFGIVNIMLVSVKERTWYIGLEKALGAPRRRILLEFLLEALILSLLGASLGLLLAWGVVSIIPDGVVNARITSAHIVLAFAVAGVLGLASGLAPAAQASRLAPVEALRK